jgi:magnesium-transporting ATPase (P-type)
MMVPDASEEILVGVETSTRGAWHWVDVPTVAETLGVNTDTGLTRDEVAARQTSVGPNRLTGGKKESAVQAFVRRYRDVMQLTLLGAAAISGSRTSWQTRPMFGARDRRDRTP